MDTAISGLNPKMSEGMQNRLGSKRGRGASRVVVVVFVVAAVVVLLLLFSRFIFYFLGTFVERLISR